MPPRSEACAERQEDLPRVAVEGRQHAFAAQRGDQLPAGAAGVPPCRMNSPVKGFWNRKL